MGMIKTSSRTLEINGSEGLGVGLELCNMHIF